MQPRDCYNCIRLHDETLCYTQLPPLDEERLRELMGRGVTLVPTRLAASPLHALQAYKLARRAVEGGWSRARSVHLETILYLLASRGHDATRLSLSKAADEGPKPGEPLVAICGDRGECEAIAGGYGCGEPSWSGVEERLALALTALAAAEVERKRRIREGTA